MTVSIPAVKSGRRGREMTTGEHSSSQEAGVGPQRWAGHPDDRIAGAERRQLRSRRHGVGQGVRMYEKNDAQQEWLESFIAEAGGVAGTVHVQRGEDLFLTAAHNIPPPVVAIVARVAHGKGMAGLAQVKKAPVQTCNLQTDQTGNVKPGAKAVNAQAAVALPVLDVAGAVRAVLGIACTSEGEIGPVEDQA